MRIVTGLWGGRSLVSPGTRVRPTAEAVRDGWMTHLQPNLAGAIVLDLFSGSGALGLEALSRGARSVDFVENGRASLHALKANVAAMRPRPRTRIFKKDVFDFLDGIEGSPYRLVLADPPYGSRALDTLIARWRAAPFSEVLAVEHASDHELKRGAQTLEFGATHVTLFGRFVPPEPNALPSTGA